MGFQNILVALRTGCAALPLAADVVLHDHAQGLPFTGPAAVLRLLRAYFVDGLAQPRVVVRTLLSGDQSAGLEFILRGRHDRPFLGLPPTGMPISVPMCLICHMDSDRLKRIDLYYDAGTLLQQLGLGV